MFLLLYIKGEGGRKGGQGREGKGRERRQEGKEGEGRAGQGRRRGVWEEGWIFGVGLLGLELDDGDGLKGLIRLIIIINAWCQKCVLVEQCGIYFDIQKYKVVLLRHGESVWNKENRFGGWIDIKLSPLGQEEAAKAGKVLKEAGFQFDAVFTSVLTRSIQSFNIMADELDCHYIPITKSWKLN